MDSDSAWACIALAKSQKDLDRLQMNLFFSNFGMLYPLPGMIFQELDKVGF